MEEILLKFYHQITQTKGVGVLSELEERTVFAIILVSTILKDVDGTTQAIV
jgi:hypothetical protein